MPTTLRDRADALAVAAEEARAKLARIEAALADAQQRAHAALVAGDMKAADTAQADAAAAQATLAPAQAVVTTVEAAQRDVLAQLQREGYQADADRLRDAVDATRLHLHQVIGEALAALREAQAKLRAAQAEEATFRQLQRESHQARVVLGDEQPRGYADRERPFDDLLSGMAAPVIRAVIDADLSERAVID